MKSIVLVGFLIVLQLFISHQSDLSPNLRAKSRKPHHKFKLGQSGLIHRYGVDLPSFSYDYSELIVSAVIERSNWNDGLVLNMIFIGHRAISNDFPFESISTDEEVLHKWSQLIKYWSVQKGKHKHSSHNVSSGLDCVIHNNEQKHTSPYHSVGHWVPITNLPEHIKGNFEVLRCKLKGSRAQYESLAHSDGHVSVDLVRKHYDTPKRNNTIHHGDFDQSNAVISFYVPWRSRFAGYGLSMHNDSTKLNPWATSALVTKVNIDSQQKDNSPDLAISQNIRSNRAPVSALHNGTVLSSQKIPTSKTAKVFLCATDFVEDWGQYPAAMRIGMPGLLEFLHHHYILGVEHIILGLQMDWGSIHMKRYLKSFAALIEAKKLSIVATNLVGYDGIAGVLGTHLHDEFAELFFMNQCMAYCKGLADVAIFLRVNEFIIPNRKEVSTEQFIGFLNRPWSYSNRRLLRDETNVKVVSGIHSRKHRPLKLNTTSISHHHNHHQQQIQDLKAYQPHAMRAVRYDAINMHIPDTVAITGLGDTRWIRDIFEEVSLYARLQHRNQPLQNQIIAVVLDESSSCCLLTRYSATGCLFVQKHISEINLNEFPEDNSNKSTVVSTRSTKQITNMVVVAYMNPYWDVPQRMCPSNNKKIDYCLYSEVNSTYSVVASLKLMRKITNEHLIRQGYSSLAKVNAISTEILWNADPSEYLPSGRTSLKKPFWLNASTDNLIDVLRTVMPL